MAPTSTSLGMIYQHLMLRELPGGAAGGGLQGLSGDSRDIDIDIEHYGHGHGHGGVWCIGIGIVG